MPLDTNACVISKTGNYSPWKDQQGNRLTIGLSNAAKGVLRTGSMLHREHTDCASAAEAGNGVGHVESGAFLPHDY
jgi:hypothetical protein